MNVLEITRSIRLAVSDVVVPTVPVHLISGERSLSQVHFCSAFHIHKGNVPQLL